MNLALTLLVMALQLKVNLLGLPAQYADLRDSMLPQVESAISFAQQVINTPVATSSPIVQIIVQPATTPSPTPSLGSTGIITQSNSIPMETLTCTLTAESNSMPPSSNVNLTWTSNAVSAQIKNSRVYDSFEPLTPATGGTKGFLMSSESGENNVFTARFVGQNGETKDCIVEVLTK